MCPTLILVGKNVDQVLRAKVEQNNLKCCRVVCCSGNSRFGGRSLDLSIKKGARSGVPMKKRKLSSVNLCCFSLSGSRNTHNLGYRISGEIVLAVATNSRNSNILETLVNLCALVDRLENRIDEPRSAVVECGFN